MKAFYNTTYILSSEDLIALDAGLHDLGAATKGVIGKYKGIEENSIVAVTEDEAGILALAKLHNQESVLRLDAGRFASLLYTNGTIEPLGQFNSVSVKPNGDYTFDGKTYYTVERN